MSFLFESSIETFALSFNLYSYNQFKIVFKIQNCSCNITYQTFHEICVLRLTTSREIRLRFQNASGDINFLVFSCKKKCIIFRNEPVSWVVVPVLKIEKAWTIVSPMSMHSRPIASLHWLSDLRHSYSMSNIAVE